MVIDLGPLVYMVLGIYVLLALVCTVGGYLMFRLLAPRFKLFITAQRQKRRLKETVRRGYMFHQPMRP